MNTGLLNWCRVLNSQRRRVFIVGQMLCLIAVAAIFVISPFVALAGCKGGGGNGDDVDEKKITKDVSVIGLVPGVTNQTVAAGLKTINAALDIPGENSGAIVVNKKFTLAEIKKGGVWITGLKDGVMFQGTFFACGSVNGGKPVCELWVAEVAPNSKGIKAGQIFKFVSMAGIPVK